MSAMTSLSLLPGYEPTAEAMRLDTGELFASVKFDGPTGNHGLLLPGTNAVTVAYARQLAAVLTTVADEIERKQDAAKPVESIPVSA